MRKLTAEEWARVAEVFDGIADGKEIQGLFKGKWERVVVHTPSLLDSPLNFRVKPEPTTVTVYVYRPKTGVISATTNPNLCALEGWELLYSFEHEVQA